MKMTGNTVLITGGGSGIGLALAESFLALGNKVILAGRRRELLDKVVAGRNGLYAATLNVEDAESIRSFAAEIQSKHPELNVVIHNAGIMRAENLLAPNYESKDAEATIATNLLGPIRLTAALLPSLMKQAQSAVVTLSSGLAFVPLAATPTYNATKAAIHSWSQSLRYQLRNTQTQVIEIIPPYVQTELLSKDQASDPRAMPLAEFIEAAMDILKNSPNVTEVIVDRVKPLRFAESNGGYEGFFKSFNDAATEVHNK